MSSDTTRLVGQRVLAEWSDRVSDLKLRQPDPYSCQAACLAMALNDRQIPRIRTALRARGTPGDPLVMAAYVKERGARYRYEPNASLRMLVDYLADGCLCVTHGWFTGSGHVIVVDGVQIRGGAPGFGAPPALGGSGMVAADLRPQDVSFAVLDPWDEFSGPLWRYMNTGKLFDGHYSARMIWAACVRGESVRGAAAAYTAGATNMLERNMWLHVFFPPDQARDGRDLVSRWGK